MDYAAQTVAFQLDMLRENTRNAMREMEIQSQFVLESVSLGVIVMEAEVDRNNSADTKRGLLRKIMDFLKKIFGSFTDKMKRIFESNLDWLKRVQPAFKDMNFDGLEMEMVPFWDGDFKVGIDKVRNQISRNSDLVNSTPTNAKQLADMDAMRKQHFSEFLDSNGDLAAGAKNYFRVGKASVDSTKPVLLSGGDLKKRMNDEFLPFCISYLNGAYSQVKGLVDTANRQFDILDKALDRKNVQKVSESMLLSTLIESTISYLPNMVVLEAEQAAPSADKPATNTSSKPEETRSATKVTLNTKGGSGANNEIRDKADNMNSDQLAAVRNFAQCVQTLTAAAMTAAEERYLTYLNAIKQVHKARKGSEGGENTTTPAKEEPATQTEQPKEDTRTDRQKRKDARADARAAKKQEKEAARNKKK